MPNTIKIGAALLVASGVFANAHAFADDAGKDGAVLPDGLEKTGETRSCLRIRKIRSIKAIDEQNFLVSLRGGQTFLNETNVKCAAADKPYTRIQYKLPNGSLCRNDIIDVIDPTTGVTLGACSLSDFQKLEAPAAQ